MFIFDVKNFITLKNVLIIFIIKSLYRKLFWDLLEYKMYVYYLYIYIEIT
jgi:hypothetical protein